MMAHFHKRHYEAVARTLRETKASQLVSVRVDTLHAWEAVVEMLDYMFRRDNIKFNSDTFRAAAGYEGET
jgi:hypothetical protein